MKKIAIVGSRDYMPLSDIEVFVKRLPLDTEVVSGGARGVDSEARRWANALSLGYKEFPADWDRHGKRAGFLRNRDIVEYADEVVAFWDGKSKGTQHSINLARQLGKPVEIIRADR